jgi:hypothetical protein
VRSGSAWIRRRPASSPPWAGPPPPRGLAASAFPLHADRAAPRGGLGEIWRGGWIRCSRRGYVCACGRRGACASESTQRVLGKRPQRLGRDANATSRPRRGGERARRGRGAGMAGLGVIGPCGTGAHARARVLASQGRGVAVPCAGHRHPGPAARRGGGRATAVAGVQRWRVGLLHKKDGTAAGRVGRSYGLLPRVHRRLMAHAGNRGKGKGWRQCGSPAGWRRGCSGLRRGEAGGSRPCRKGCGVGVVDRAQAR